MRILIAICFAITAGIAFGQNSPKLEVIPEMWDFGSVSGTEKLEHTFEVKNTGSDTLIIKSVSTSCGCTSASLFKEHLASSETTELKVTLDSSQIKAEGKTERQIYLESNDPQAPLKIVKVMLQIDSPQKEKASAFKQNTVKASIKVKLPPKISSRKLYSLVQAGKPVTILDVREENEYRGKHIPQAVWFPKSKFDKQDTEVLGKLEHIDKRTILVAYCGAGHRSAYVTRKLREMGYNAYNLDGISFWEKENLPLIQGPKLPPSQEPSVIYLEEAYENYYLLFKDVVWVDVREKEDYNRGHVKGALGISLSEFAERLGEISKDKEVVLYCEGTWDGGSCEASASAGRILIRNGYKQGNIKVFEDGYGAWENAGYPVEKNSSEQ